VISYEGEQKDETMTTTNQTHIICPLCDLP
jgi:hypothetical protein